MLSVHSISRGDPAFIEGEALYRRGSVSQPGSALYELRYTVGSVPAHSVTFLKNGNVHCTCNSEGLCQHIAAAYLAADNDGSLKRFQKDWQHQLGQQMLSALTRAMPGGESIRLVAQLRLYEDGGKTFPYDVELEVPVRTPADGLYKIEVLREGTAAVAYVNSEAALSFRMYDIPTGHMGLFSLGTATFSDIALYTDKH